jgi:glucosylceramidase
MPGARLLETKGETDNLLAFINPDGSIVLIVRNEAKYDTKINIKNGREEINPLLKADSFNTFILK